MFSYRYAYSESATLVRSIGGTLNKFIIACPSCENRDEYKIQLGKGKRWNCKSCRHEIVQYDGFEGIIYIFSNPDHDLLKIGQTTRTARERCADLSRGTGVASKFDIEAFFPSHSLDRHERTVHRRLSKYRRPGKEFFSVPIKKAIEVIERVCGLPAMYVNPSISEAEEAKLPEEKEVDRKTSRELANKPSAKKTKTLITKAEKVSERPRKTAPKKLSSARSVAGAGTRTSRPVRPRSPEIAENYYKRAKGYERSGNAHQGVRHLIKAAQLGHEKAQRVLADRGVRWSTNSDKWS